MARSFKIPQFNEETGEGTLSSISKRFGVSTEDIVSANKNNTEALPDPNNPDRIQAGASLTIPNKKETQQSTTAKRGETRERSERVNGLAERRAEADSDDEARKENIRKELADIRTRAEDIKAQIQERNAKKAEEGGKTEGGETQDGLLDDQDQIAIADAEAEAESEIVQTNAKLDSIKSLMSEANTGLINSVKQIYGARMDAMKESNRRALATKEQVGLRSGRSRFLPQMQQGILTAEELDGHQRIAKLEGEMLQTIAEIQQAEADDRLDIFNTRVDRLNEIEENMQDTIQDIHDRAVEEHNQILEQKKEQRQLQKQTFEQSIDWAENVAPAVSNTLQDFDTVEEQVEFLQEYAERSGRPFDILMGAVQDRLTEEEAQELQNEARRASTASSRSLTQQRSQDINQESTKRQVRTKIIEKFTEFQEEDGTVPDDVWQEARRAWITAELPGNEFEKEFEQFKKGSGEDLQ